ncbi:MAG: hypothetical protein SGPRY_013185, partial [Prymnesium sp.]
EAEAQADLLRRLSFAVWAGEYNQYVGALQGLLIERVVAGFKYGLGVEKADDARWMVQAFLCVRVLALRVAPEHLTALWPIAMAELQRILLQRSVTRPALLLAACQLIDTLLAVLPDDFSSFSWMRRPLLGMRSLQRADELALFASKLSSHLASSALQPRATELDVRKVVASSDVTFTHGQI